MLEDLPDGFLHALLLLLPGNDSLQLTRTCKSLRRRVLAAPALNAGVTVGVSMLEVLICALDQPPPSRRSLAGNWLPCCPCVAVVQQHLPWGILSIQPAVLRDLTHQPAPNATAPAHCRHGDSNLVLVWCWSCVPLLS